MPPPRATGLVGLASAASQLPPPPRCEARGSRRRRAAGCELLGSPGPALRMYAVVSVSTRAGSWKFARHDAGLESSKGALEMAQLCEQSKGEYAMLMGCSPCMYRLSHV